MRKLMYQKSNMKLNIFVSLIMLLAIVNSGIGITYSAQSSSSPTLIGPIKGKGGYEFYSWQTQGRWNFALLSATNILKSVEQITVSPDTVSENYVKLSGQGIEAIKSQLNRLPRNEHILWISKLARVQSLVDAGPIEMPSQPIIDAIADHCKKLGLELSLV